MRTDTELVSQLSSLIDLLLPWQNQNQSIWMAGEVMVKLHSRGFEFSEDAEYIMKEDEVYAWTILRDSNDTLHVCWYEPRPIESMLVQAVGFNRTTRKQRRAR